MSVDVSFIESDATVKLSLVEPQPLCMAKQNLVHEGQSVESSEGDSDFCISNAKLGGSSNYESNFMLRSDFKDAVAESSLQDMADFLSSGFWGGSGPRHHNLGNTGEDPNNGVLYFNVTGYGSQTGFGYEDYNGVSDERAKLIRDALDLYEDVLGIDFVESTSTDDAIVDIFFTDYLKITFARSTLNADGTINYSTINIAKAWGEGESSYASTTLQTILHEIGHALGLGHQGHYNGGADYGSDAMFEMDSVQASMMSYFTQHDNTTVSASDVYLQTPMAVDWLALDGIYSQYGFGIGDAFFGDTTYGFRTNIAADDNAIWNSFSELAPQTAGTIVDGHGIDTIDLSGYSERQKIDLTVQVASQTSQDSSNIGGLIGNLTLAVGTVIENAVGGGGPDEMIGNEASNILIGRAGDDVLFGMSGSDTLRGSSGVDRVYGGSGIDDLRGGSGSDLLRGQGGDDSLVGGRGRDRMFGGTGDDTIKGKGGKDELFGGAGSDSLSGGKGADTFVFETDCGYDTISDFDAVTDQHDWIDFRGLDSIKSWHDLLRNHLKVIDDDILIDGGNGDMVLVQNISFGGFQKGNFIF